MTGPTQLAAWQKLADHAAEIENTDLKALFAADHRRFDALSYRALGLLVDFSKQRINHDTLTLLTELAAEAGVQHRIKQMFSGGRINNTEDRSVLHTALRQPEGSVFPSQAFDVMPEVREVVERMYVFADRVRSGEWKGFSAKPISDVVNIGIGGSDLGPAMVAHALSPLHDAGLRGHFVSNIDGAALARTLAPLNPETTLFIVASKTFSTQETLANATSARRWLLDHFEDERAVARHFVAVSTEAERVSAFGIDVDNMFGFWDWVGGRYSVWSAIGLSLILLLGPRVFDDFLAGAAELDEHFRTKSLDQNLPILLGLIGIWNRNFVGAGSHAVLAYDFGLEKFPSYLQQLEMESNGKHVTRTGKEVEVATCPIVWGGLGNNGQHAFYQLMHQGTSLLSSDFLVALHSQLDPPDHQRDVLSNAFGQSQALMNGRNFEQALEQGRSDGLDGDSLTLRSRHRVVKGNQPSTTIVYDKLDASTLGKLVALYEHKVFVQSVIWDINAFDQWGVELGKELAGVIGPQLESGQGLDEQDSSTRGLIEYSRARK